MSQDAQLKALNAGRSVQNARSTRYTDQVPTRLCLRFGIAAWLTVRQGDHMPDRVRLVVTHPRLTRRGGASATEDSFYTPVARGLVWAYFLFQEPWEMQPGVSTFALRSGGTTLVAKSFTVTPPDGKPGGSGCEAETS